MSGLTTDTLTKGEGRLIVIEALIAKIYSDKKWSEQSGRKHHISSMGSLMILDFIASRNDGVLAELCNYLLREAKSGSSDLDRINASISALQYFYETLEHSYVDAAYSELKELFIKAGGKT